MKEFLKDNITIVAAILLPLALAGVFALSTMTARITVADPRYDFLVATNYSDSDSMAFRLDVVQEKLVVSYRPPEKDKNNNYIYNTLPRLWRVHVPEMKIEEIALQVPADKKAMEIKIPGVTDVKVSNIQPDPDGYSFETSYYYDHNLMSEIFSGSSRSRNSVALLKNGRAVVINVPDANGWSYNTRFIGWIIGQE